SVRGAPTIERRSGSAISAASRGRATRTRWRAAWSTRRTPAPSRSRQSEPDRARRRGRGSASVGASVPIEVATHSGPFHADDVLAWALIRVFYAADATVVRTRDADRLARAEVVF